MMDSCVRRNDGGALYYKAVKLNLPLFAARPIFAMTRKKTPSFFKVNDGVLKVLWGVRFVA